MSWNTKIPKFRRFVLQNFPFIEEDFDALTDYELICKVVEYLNTVIQSQNELITETESFETSVTNDINAFKTTVNNEINTFETNITSDFEELEGLFNTLKNYVDNYFDNLDVQEEINNKLDEMVEDGVLQQIIADYLKTQIIFNTTVDMITNASTLVNGVRVETLGYHTINDNGASFFEIKNTGTANGYSVIDLQNGLFAHMVYKKDFVTPEMFGAYGDGTHDDSASIQFAFNTGKIVEFAPKTYLCFSLVTNNDLIIHGNGATLKRPELDVAPYNKTVSEMKWIRTIVIEHNCTIENLNFDNNCFTMWQVSDGYAQEQSASLVVQNATQKINFHISNCSFKNSAGDGLHIVQNVNAFINNCVSTDCFRGGFTSSGYGSNIELNGWTSNSITAGVPDGFDIEVDSASTIDANTYNANITNVVLDYDLDIYCPKYGNINISNITMRPFDQDELHGFLFSSKGGHLNVSNSVLRSGLLGTSQTFISQDGVIYINNCKIIGNSTEAIFKITQYQETTLGSRFKLSNSKVEGYQLFAAANFFGDIEFNGNDITCTKINTGVSNVTCNPANLFLINNNIVLSGTDSLDATVFGANQYTPSGYGRYHLYGNTFSGNPNAILYCSGDPLIYFDNTPYDALFRLRKSNGSHAKFYGNNRLILVPTATDLTFPGFVAGEDIAIALDTGNKYKFTSGSTWTQLT